MRLSAVNVSAFEKVQTWESLNEKKLKEKTMSVDCFVFVRAFNRQMAVQMSVDKVCFCAIMQTVAQTQKPTQFGGNLA